MRSLVVLLMAFVCVGCGRRDAPPAARHATESAPSSIAGTNPAPEPAEGWLRPAKDFASTRYSELAEITTTSVRQLGLKLTFSTGVVRGHEAAPLVIGGVMYIVAPFPNTLFALDLTQPGAPVKWRYDPAPDSMAQGVACCDVVNRGAAYADGLIVYNTLDAHTVAVDAVTGQERWTTRLGDIARGETITMAPLIVKDKVLVGNSGGELGVRGWVTALDLRSGRIVWRGVQIFC